MKQNAILMEPRQIASDVRKAWPLELQKEFDRNEFNGAVGSTLVSETDRMRVWHFSLPAGTRYTFHRHVLDYFWSCHTVGKARGYYDDGRIIDVDHYAGQTKHFVFKKGAHFTHSVENIGDTDLHFTTVEFLNTSENEPLPIDDTVRLQPPF